MSNTLSWNLVGDDRLSSTLDKLDRTLSKLGGDMDRTTTQASKLGNELDKTSSRSTRLDSTFKVVQQGASGAAAGIASAVGWLKNLAVAGSVAFLAVAGAAAGFGVKTAAANETAKITFDLLLGSQEKSLQFMKDLQAFAAATPFDMPTIRDAASRFLAVGIAAKDVIPILTRVGDATAGMGTGAEGIQRAVYALQQIKSGGVAQMDDLNQLSDAGIPIIDALAAHFHTTALKIRKEFAPKGLITADDVFGALQNGEGAAFGRLNGVMAKQALTVAGIWSTLKDNVGQSLATFMEPALPAIKKVLDWAGVNFPKALNFIQGWGAKVAHIFDDSAVPGQVMASLEKFGKQLLPQVKDAFEEVYQWVVQNKDGLEDFGHFLAEVVIPIAAKFAEWLIWLAVHGVEFAGAILTHVVPALRFMTETWLTAAATIIHSAAEAFGWIPGLGDKLKQAAADSDAFRATVEQNLNKLDGKTANVYLQQNVLPPGAHQSFGAAPGPTVSTAASPKGHARGGPNDAGWMLTGEEGAELWYATQPGMTKTRSQTSSALGGGGDVDAVAPLTINVEGYGIWQGLLRFKRSNGKATLGLA